VERGVGHWREKREERFEGEQWISSSPKHTATAGGNKKKKKPIVNLVVEIQLLNLDQ
jgi:hypothetical protein